MPRKRIGPSWSSTVSELVARRRTFERLVGEAIDGLPDDIRRRLENVGIVIEEGSGPGSTLGVYEGIPQTERDGGYSGVLPDLITIYRQPIEARARTPLELEREVRRTVLHEIAHHFGISDERLREIGGY